jgi:hypothetical protein
MRIQQVTKSDGVRERCIAGVGATPVLRTFRVGSAALVAPTPVLPAIQKYRVQIQDTSAPDTKRINSIATEDSPTIPTSSTGEHHEQTETRTRRQQDSAR